MRTKISNQHGSNNTEERRSLRSNSSTPMNLWFNHPAILSNFLRDREVGENICDIEEQRRFSEVHS